MTMWVVKRLASSRYGLHKIWFMLVELQTKREITRLAEGQLWGRNSNVGTAVRAEQASATARGTQSQSCGVDARLPEALKTCLKHLHAVRFRGLCSVKMTLKSAPCTHT